ncbi:M23 family metallopeptidase [Streptomyces sp. OF3]|uniref:M23 family metallopeptidase n=2 Tax=Streptomyces alkaliterrae TaxID=2213162 RepID=A0A5P0YVG9_9ACTN|nr:M23 family metallopeptidase [Streptomyces alkaliterrae]MBB1261887.1 M23 family metallopeptidase [Streptomyces alkaliterrae]MQS04288.1 peptidoglycan DD-metalloendopeptidase family protein [Streptomyces alkaliterrae]
MIGVGALGIVVSVTLRQGIGVLYVTSVVLLLAGLVLQRTRAGAQRPTGREPVVAVRAPFEGTWRAVNSPADKVPSHGVHSLAQTYAIDVTYEPGDRPGRRFDAVWPLARRPESFPTFGRPMLAPAEGVVVAAHDGQRDHLTRMSSLGVAYLVLEGFVRAMGRPRHMLGNHVVLDLGDGVYALLAHLRRGSLRVAAGDRVGAGQVLAECGNSGNSSDPHLHFQLMDGADAGTARGVPFRWHFEDADGKRHLGVPSGGSDFVPAPAEV